MPPLLIEIDYAGTFANKHLANVYICYITRSVKMFHACSKRLLKKNIKRWIDCQPPGSRIWHGF